MINDKQLVLYQSPVGATANPASAAKAPGASPANSCVDSETNEAIYQRVYDNLTERYEAFNSSAETGFKGAPGLTSHIADITKKDLISMLSHIRDTPDLLVECQINSSKATFFDKFYLMRNPDQQWNLRLHHYNVRGSGLGGEDSPHYHRWTLASASLAGGYVNVSYEESEKDESSKPEFVYHKYALPPNNAQANNKEREMDYLGEKVMTPIKKEIYAEGRLNHFPIAEPHSVQTFPEYFGSTLTLAHTSASSREFSPIFEKEKLKSIPQVRNEKSSSTEFRQRLEQEITFLQILDLKDELQIFLKEKYERGDTLTSQEVGHFYDSSEANYVETSLLSALAIHKLEKENAVEHSDLSADTVKFLDVKIAQMEEEALMNIIKVNQEDLADKKKLFTVSVDAASELGQLLTKTQSPSQCEDNLTHLLARRRVNNLITNSLN